MQPSPLDPHDPRVVAAREAERALFERYGIQATERFVTLPEPQIRVRVLEFGAGEPLVIVPGNTGDSYALAPLVAQVKGRRIIAINRPGGGLSEGMDHRTVDIRRFAPQSLAFVLDALGLSDVDVVAHSMGAHWSVLLAMDHPAKVRRLVLLGNPGNIMGGKPPLAVRLLAIPALTNILMRLLVSRKPDDALRGWTRMGHAPAFVSTLPQEMREAAFRFQRLPNFALSTSSLIQNMIPELRAADLAALRQPTLLILGTNDNFTTQANGRAIAAAMPHGSFLPIEGAGHLPWLEQPATVGRAVLDFVNAR